MPALRREFYRTLRQMLIVSDLSILTDILPANSSHNISARILRYGLAISAFASLEKYLEARVDVLVQKLSASPIVASSLGDELRAFLSIDAIIGLANRLNFAEKTTKQAYADANLAALARYSSNPACYTALGFSPRGSNVSEADVAKALSVLCIEKPWKRLGEIASEVGSSRVSLKDDFVGLSKMRHRSAHEPSSNIPSADLKTHIEISILIAVCFDCISETISIAMTTASGFSAYKSSIGKCVIKYRFIDAEISGTWVERSSDGKKIRKRYSDENSAINGALGRTSEGIVIVRDSQGVPLAVI